MLDSLYLGGETDAACHVLTGMGGTGKSQLAAHHARRALQAGQIDLLVWVTAPTRSAIIDIYAQAAVDILDASPDNAEAAAAAFLAWLEPKAPASALAGTATGHQGPDSLRWLVVLDDLTHPGDLRGLRPPASPTGRTLVTTRRRDAALTGRSCQPVPVGLFTPQEACAYLTDALTAHSRHEPAEQLTALAADLGHLPLALSQAAAYLVDTGLGCAAYRQRLVSSTFTLAQALPEAAVLPDDQTTTAAAAWSLSVDHADQIRPAGFARPMLQLLSLLDPNGIPGTVLVSPHALHHLNICGAALRRDPAQPPATADTTTSVLQTLQRLSLIDYTPGDRCQTVRIHRLVQRTIRESLTTGEHTRAARAAADALFAAWPDIERDRDLTHALRANADALTSYAEDALWQPEAHPVMYRAGRSLGGSGQTSAAVSYFQRVERNARHHCGPDHTDTLFARNDLAQWQGESGDAAGAATAFAELLQDYRRVLGPDHPYTLTTRSNLASMQRRTGDAASAAESFAELLEDSLRVLGPDHPDTLGTRNNLASALAEAGDAAGAVESFAELLEDRTRVLGPDHPDTLGTRNNLAHWLGVAGDAAGAATAYTQLLEDLVRVLGPDHPDTLTTRNNLAHLRGAAGDAAGAATTHTQLLEDRLRVLGPDHPDTLTTRNNLAFELGQAGDPAGAASEFAKLLEDSLRVLGPDHPDTLTTRNNLAHWRVEAGDEAGAAGTYAELLADSLRVFGPEHPSTLTIRNNLANSLGKAGDTDGAVSEFMELLEIQARVSGPDHPNTLTIRSNLAHWRALAGDSAGAALAFTELLEDQKRVLGPDHPAIRTTRHNIAYLLGEADKEPGAATTAAEPATAPDLGAPDPGTDPDCRESTGRDAVDGAAALFKDRMLSLGPAHPDTLKAQAGLAYERGAAGDPAGAAATQEKLLKACLGALGPDHPDTLTTWDLLASSLSEAGDPAGAAAAMEELLAARLRLLGPEDPDTLSARGYLAYWQGLAGDTAGAAAAFKRLLEDYLRVLGPDHPSTLATRAGVAYWQAEADADTP
ncbi:tetratricopeptide repeat protein [Streptomyces avidinii]|uniref:tetratricopeptide repeat protein n=1 Tax=Streptomyces avidinii TaxID=1895 RepID=UPI00386749A5|nr:tetratricopeptide repeat protein [Streptomyces avidinii]